MSLLGAILQEETILPFSFCRLQIPFGHLAHQTGSSDQVSAMADEVQAIIRMA
jgi:hypothetical protein